MTNVYSEAETASRYDFARSLPSQTITLWLDSLRDAVPATAIEKILDLGCGTGRFTSALAETFGGKAVGVEPSAAMLDIARARPDLNVEWRLGHAENIPMPDEAVDLVFISQVFHHFVEPQRALREIHRVLTQAGYLAIRNGTREHNDELAWLRFFPEAYEIEQQRTPSSQEIDEMVSAQSFVSLSHRVIHQLFASSYVEYFEKISRRALSALAAISDEAFHRGVQEFQEWANLQPRDVAVYEPVDLFIFSKESFS